MTLTVRGLSFSYDSQTVLEDVDLDIGGGEVLGLVGPNGAGKSTLLECINRVLTPDAGTLVVDGTNLNDLSRDGIARLVGYVPQEESDAFPSTVFDTVLMGRMPHGSWKPSEGDFEIVDEILTLLDLQDLAMRNVDELSGGQRQKVLVGRALSQESDVLLLDEPTSSLDLRHQIEVMDLITQQVREHDIATAIAIHDLNLASRYCDTVAMLHEKQIFAAGDPAEILSTENIRTVYGVHVRIFDDDGERTIVPTQPVEADATHAEPTMKGPTAPSAQTETPREPLQPTESE